MSIDIDIHISDTLERAYNSFGNMSEGKNKSRYKSWEYCHSIFLEMHQKKSLTDKDYDLLALNLAFYLASWGMLRNSQLLNRDYKCHIKCVKEIMKKDFNELWDFEPKGNEKDKEIEDLIFKDNEGIYSRIINSYDFKPSETLVTKILLGTFACITAFDRYFKDGCEKPCKKHCFGEKHDKISKFKALCNFAIEHKSALLSSEFAINKKYPLMKNLDLYFWRIEFVMSLLNVSDNKSKIEKSKQILIDEAFFNKDQLEKNGWEELKNEFIFCNKQNEVKLYE